MSSFVVENVSVPPEVEQAIDKRASMSVVKDLNDYVKYQLAQGFEKGAVGAAGVGAEMAVGMSVAQQMLNQQPAKSAQPVMTEVLSPEQVAKILKVPEPDVITSLESGDLKGKKIGSQWRVTQAAIDQFLR
jgi:excisionase family DNA binding protein